MSQPCNVLMLYPQFTAESFWSFGESCKLMGVQRPAAPLGLITIAAMLPESWTVRLIDCNTQAFGDDDLAWADVVFTGGMLPQQADTLRLIDACRTAGKPVEVGGPDPTSSPHIYEKADFQVLGEAESVIDEFLAAWDIGARTGVFTATRTAVADLHELRQARHLVGAHRGADDRGLCASRTVLAQGHRRHRRAPRRAG